MIGCRFSRRVRSLSWRPQGCRRRGKAAGNLPERQGASLWSYRSISAVRYPRPHYGQYFCGSSNPVTGFSSRSIRDVVAGLHHADSHSATHCAGMSRAFYGLSLPMGPRISEKPKSSWYRSTGESGSRGTIAQATQRFCKHLHAPQGTNRGRGADPRPHTGDSATRVLGDLGITYPIWRSLPK